MDVYMDVEDPAGEVCLWYSNVGQRMPELVEMLGQLGYPASTRMLLGWLHIYFQQCENFPPGKFPNQEHVKTLIQEFVFYKSPEKKIQQMTPLKELQMLEELCRYFHENPDLSTIHNIFDSLFGNSGHPLKEADEQRHRAMMQLVSMAISIACPSVLECAAVWMFSQDSSSLSISLADSVMTDFCELVPEVKDALQAVPRMSPLFTFHLLTSLMSHYNTYQSTSQPIKLIPPTQLDIIADWITDHPAVCLRHTVTKRHPASGRVPPFYIHTSHSSSSSHHHHHDDPSNSGPVPGLVWQSVLSPLILDTNCAAVQKTIAAKKCSLHDYALLFSKLHLGILQAFVAAAEQRDAASTSSSSSISKPKSRGVALTMVDVESVVMLTVHFIQDNKVSEGAIQTALERIAQLLQVAMATGMLSTTKDKVIPLCKELPHNDLLTVILHGKLPT